MTLPNFIIIGVQKAATTSIYNYLKQHPQIYMSPAKETSFLEKNWDAEAIAPEMKYNKVLSLESFEDQFRDVTTETAIGTTSPNCHFLYETAADRILEYTPNAKLILILRNPIDRAYSDHLMHIRDAIDDKTLDDRLNSPSSFIIRKGFYAEQLQHYRDRFPFKQIKVFLHDDLRKNTIEFMQEMYHFLEVDPNFIPDTTKKAQVSQVPKSKKLNRVLRNSEKIAAPILPILKRLFPFKVREGLRSLKSKLLALNTENKKPQLSEEHRRRLRDIYREDILKLQTLIERDLSHWLS
ncbi:sulfotransferase [Oxynema sp. CENA135]|uniref:sulfotransferase family protein n=1 Tax=Oxynema sp. CENA135 TaxID=984206 RepID=UPI001909E3C5|nr:sulfotransferase [Oxynema sp. CENA135]MBK4729080.1 sulfotransferase [Oxynema sp. CENA135]